MGWQLETILIFVRYFTKVFGRHVASDRMVSGAYKSEYGDADEITKCLNEVAVGCFVIERKL